MKLNPLTGDAEQPLTGSLTQRLTLNVQELLQAFSFTRVLPFETTVLELDVPSTSKPA